MDPALHQQPLSHFASFPQETPIRPSQVPNLLSHPAPRRGLPLQTPEERNMNTLSPNWHPAGMIYPAALVSSSSTNIVSPVNSLLKDRLGPLKPFPPSHGHVLSSPFNGATPAREYLGPQHMIRLGSGYFTSPQVVLASQTKTHTSAERSFIPTIFNSPSPQSGKNISNSLPSCLSRRDQGAESKIPSSNSGKIKDVSQREDPNKALLNKLRDFLHNVHLYKSCVSVRSEAVRKFPRILVQTQRDFFLVSSKQLDSTGYVVHHGYVSLNRKRSQSAALTSDF
ncbi:hypothetical protein CCH79_00001655, partial [Gambusia affinis]